MNTLPRSVAAILGALGAALLVQVALSLLLRTTSPLLESSSWVNAHADIVTAAASVSGFLVMAVAAGFALGRLVPGNPIRHTLLLGVATPVIGYAVAGQAALAVGWQVPMYAGQLCVAGLIAIRVHERRLQNAGGEASPGDVR